VLALKITTLAAFTTPTTTSAKSDARIGEVSPSIGKAPDHRSFALDVEPRALVIGLRRAAATFRSPLWRSSAGRRYADMPMLVRALDHSGSALQ
jgi:hypothetical protein